MRTSRLVVIVVLAGCARQSSPPPTNRTGNVPAVTAPKTLAEARKGFTTKPAPRPMDKEPVERPPANVFKIVQYDSPVGKLAAYLTPDSKDGKKHPGVIWITGGDCNSIGDVWRPAPAKNDQTASAFRKAGVTMMFPSLRGGNENPGVREGFYGEVDDVLAAADFLARQPYVDPARIYLGGHSTGGTLALLTAECSGRFRAVFSFGPVENVAGYGPEYLHFDYRDEKELAVRAPILWLDGITSPVFVFEGAGGNIESLQAMARACKNQQVHFVPVKRADHFSILAPVTKLVAKKVLADDGPTCNLTFTEDEVNKLIGR